MANELAKKGRAIANLNSFRLPVPSTYDVIYGLAMGQQNEIFLSVSAEFAPGTCACIYAFDRSKQSFRKVIDFAEATRYEPASGMMPHSKVHLALNSSPEGRVFAASHFTAPALGQQDFDPIEAYRGSYLGSFLLEYNANSDQVTNYGCLLPGEGCRISTLDANHGYVYLVSYPRNHLFQFHCNSRMLRDLGRLGQENCFGLDVDERGNVYTSDDLGRFLKFSLQDDRLTELDCFVPLRSGRRRQGNFIRRMTKGCDGRFYGFGNKGARLFSFSPAEEAVVDFGPVLGHEARLHYEYPLLPPAKALVQTDPRSLYIAFGGDGIYMDDGQIPCMVKYDLGSREAVELGKFVAEDGMVAWIPQCALYCEDENAVYFGMQQAVDGLRLWKVSLTPEPSRTIHVRRDSPEFRKHCENVKAVFFGRSVEGQSELPYVKRGRVTMTELGWFGEGMVIPPGESAIADLCFAGEALYGVTVGRRAHLFRYAPYQTNRFVENFDVHVADLGVLSESGVTEGRVFERPKTKTLIIMIRTDNGLDCIEYDLVAERQTYRPHIHSVPHWSPFHSDSNPFRRLFTCLGNELHLKNCVFDAQGESFYLTDAGQRLVRFSLPTGEQTAWPCILLRDSTFAPIKSDRFFAVSAEGEALVFNFSGLTSPTKVATGIRNHDFTCATVWENTRSVVLGTSEGNLLLCQLNANGPPRVISLPNRRKARAVVGAASGLLYGFCGKDNEIGEAFFLSVDTFTASALGILQVCSTPRFWIAHCCDCMISGRDGEIYFGEADRISHLFAYYPPTRLA